MRKSHCAKEIGFERLVQIHVFDQRATLIRKSADVLTCFGLQNDFSELIRSPL